MERKLITSFTTPIPFPELHDEMERLLMKEERYPKNSEIVLKVSEEFENTLDLFIERET